MSMPKPAAASIKKPAAASSKKRPAGATATTKKTSESKLDFLEICAYEQSALAHEWAKRGKSTVRISHKKDGKPSKPGPQPILGRALTWHLDLHDKRDRKLLSSYVADKRPRDVWSSAPLNLRPAPRMFMCVFGRQRVLRSGMSTFHLRAERQQS